jgi:phosphatidylglycerophosphatase A
MTFARRALHGFATWGGLGLLPKAPGTFGSIGAIPLHLLLTQLPATAHAACVVLLTLLGMYAAQVVADDLGNKDPSRVVIDEVAGTLIAMGAVRSAPWWLQAVALLAFRGFDIFKPPPIRQAERVQPAGVGIVLDDLIAGVFAAAVALSLQLFLR